MQILVCKFCNYTIDQNNKCKCTRRQLVSSEIKFTDFKNIETLVKERVGGKFVIGFMEDNGSCSTYISDELTDMEICYIADTINGRRR